MARTRPTHLVAICAYDGASEMYREWMYHGGIPTQGVIVVAAGDGASPAPERGPQLRRGLACLLEDRVAPDIAAGRLVRVLEDLSPLFPGFFLYYAGRRQTPPALRALIDFLQLAKHDDPQQPTLASGDARRAGAAE